MLGGLKNGLMAQKGPKDLRDPGVIPVQKVGQAVMARTASRVHLAPQDFLGRPAETVRWGHRGRRDTRDRWVCVASPGSLGGTGSRV